MRDVLACEVHQASVRDESMNSPSSTVLCSGLFFTKKAVTSLLDLCLLGDIPGKPTS